MKRDGLRAKYEIPSERWSSNLSAVLKSLVSCRFVFLLEGSEVFTEV